jgi:hypothetical protein
MHGLVLAGWIAAAAGAGLAQEDAQCRVVRYAADGERTETPPSPPYKRPPGVAVSAHSTGGSASSVAVSSSSSSSGPSVVRSRVGKRTITKTYDDAGCTVVIDERPDQGARP